MVEGTGFENQQARKGLGSSNLPLSAITMSCKRREAWFNFAGQNNVFAIADTEQGGLPYEYRAICCDEQHPR